MLSNQFQGSRETGWHPILFRQSKCFSCFVQFHVSIHRTLTISHQILNHLEHDAALPGITSLMNRRRYTDFICCCYIVHTNDFSLHKDFNNNKRQLMIIWDFLFTIWCNLAFLIVRGRLQAKQFYQPKNPIQFDTCKFLMTSSQSYMLKTASLYFLPSQMLISSSCLYWY